MNMPIIPPTEVQTDHLSENIRQITEQFTGARTLRDAMAAIGSMGDFSHDKNFMSLHRSLFDGYVDRDDYSFEKWSFEFGERMKDTKLEKSFTELVAQMTTDADKGDLFQQVVNTYVALETFGVTQERSGKKQQLKKNSFTDLYKDAAHVFYATKSDYFVSDDIGIQQKAFIVYKLMGFDTQVWSTEDFIQQSPTLLENEGRREWFFQRIPAIAREGTILHHSEDGTNTLREIALPVFNYFNRFQLNNYPEGRSLQLFRNCRRQTVLLFSEMALVIDKLTAAFGDPVSLPILDYSRPLRQYEPGDILRVWHTGQVMITLQLEKNYFDSGFLLLGLVPIKVKDKATVS